MPIDTQVVFAKPAAHSCDLLAVCVREGTIANGKISDAHLNDLDRALNGLVRTCAEQEEFTGKEGQQLSLHTHGKIAADRLLVLGLGNRGDADRGRDGLRTAAARAVKAARSAGARKIAIVWPHSEGGAKAEAADGLNRDVQAAAEGALLGAYSFDKYKKEKKPLKLARVDILVREERAARRGGQSGGRAALSAAARLGARIAEATALARDLVNEPAGQVTPSALAKWARDVAEEHGLQVEVLGRAQIRKLNMNLFLGVAQGSEEEPQLVRLSYVPGGKASKKPVALVGKAITFDSGGLSLKTAQGMEDMKTDMAGAAAVIAAMSLVPEIAPPFPVHGFFGACENLPSGTAYKPGDVLVGRNGVSVEVLNTDAEGRLVLGDVLAWAAEREPAAIVDLATLTGAIIVALGPWTSGLFSNDAQLGAELREAAKAAGESVWPMPLPPEMEELIKSPIADLKNTGGRFGGAINAALFLQHFVGKTPWAHLDIAGPSSLDKEKGYNPRGGTGAGVRLVAEWLRSRAARSP
ncbi:MAG TPA: leucyl aminopeptidase [Myxococcales bacterium]|nr:leucyl aminopeptidase [Myxococcales bacterium]